MNLIDRRKHMFSAGSTGYMPDPRPLGRAWSRSVDWAFEAADMNVGDIILPLKNLASHGPGLQGDRLSCVAFSVAAVIRQQINYNPSLLHLWYCSRQNHGAEHKLTGTYISSCLHAMDNRGFGPESLWPYDLSDDAAIEVPSLEVRQYADDNRKRVHYLRMKDDYEQSYSFHRPLIVGLRIGDTFLEYEGGEHDVLSSAGRSAYGGHCVAAFGFRTRYRGGSLEREHAIVNFWQGWGSPLTDAEGYHIDGQCAWISEEIMREATDVWSVALPRSP